MTEPLEAALSIKNYLKKLLRILTQEATISFGKKKIITRNRVNDILCCIDATFPAEYKEYVSKNGPKGLKTSMYYLQLLAAIKNKSILGSSYFSVNFDEATQYINSMIASVESDFQRATQSGISMF